MPQIPDDAAFQRFTVQRKKNLERIARATRGEYRFGDVVNEAWIMALRLQTKEGGLLDLTDEDCQHRLLSHLYQHLVRYTSKKFAMLCGSTMRPREARMTGTSIPWRTYWPAMRGAILWTS